MMEKEKQLIPQLRFPEFEGKWRSIKIGEIGKPSMCKRILKEQTLNEGDIPFYKIGTFGKKADAYINNDLYVEYKTKYSFPKKGDILISASGTIGRTVIYDGKPAFFQDSNIVWIANNEENILNALLVYSYENVRWTTENTTIARLYNDNLKSISLNIPQLPEQQKIASFLTDVDAKITKLTKKKTFLAQYKKGVMQKIFKQEIRFKDDEGNVFSDWQEKKLGEVSNITTGSSNRQDSGLDGQYTFFDRSEDIRTSSRYLFDGKAVIVAGEGSHFVPKYYVGKFDLHQRTYAIMDFKESDSKFIYFYIHFHRRYFLSQAVGSTVKSLRLPMFQKMPILLPEKEEQTKIANFLSAIDLKIEALNTKIENSKTFKKGLLQQMFV